MWFTCVGYTYVQVSACFYVFLLVSPVSTRINVLWSVLILNYAYTGLSLSSTDWRWALTFWLVELMNPMGLSWICRRVLNEICYTWRLVKSIDTETRLARSLLCSLLILTKWDTFDTQWYNHSYCFAHSLVVWFLASSRNILIGIWSVFTRIACVHVGVFVYLCVFRQTNKNISQAITIHIQSDCYLCSETT